MEDYDFSGWATKNNIKCSDGRVILKDAFKECDGQKVPLVWNHQHNDPFNILGHAMLENRKDGVYAYCKFNDSESGQSAKELVKHGDVSQLSIFANKLKQQGANVLHGAIREVSLVLAGANQGAMIDSIMMHGEESEEDAVIFTGEDIMLSHSDDDFSEEDKEETIEHACGTKKKKKELEHVDESQEDKTMAEAKKEAADGEETIADVFNTLNEKQKTVVYAMIGQALEDKNEEDEDEEGDKNMKHNVFDTEDTQDDVLTHAAMDTIIGDGKRFGSLKESFLAHADEYGITNIDYLFPEAQSLNTPPDFIKREMGWVQKVMNGTHHTPFSRIKSMFADITEDEARAKGYIKGKLKKEEVFSLLKRTTTPTTIYKKQKLDRDDVIDITDFDVVAWLKSEMRLMLDEEIARAILIGDGRLASSDDKINEANIRPVWTDDELYTIKNLITMPANYTEDELAKTFIRNTIKSRKNYKGSGTPTLFTTEDVVTDCLLLEDTTGRRIYTSIADLTTTLRVKEIVTVEVMENSTRTVDSKERKLLGLIVNLADYNVGADKGGSVNMFDDFDIDYNQQKYLIETRCSGALTKPYSAIAIEMEVAAGAGA